MSALKIPGFRWVATLYALDYVVELASSVALMVLVYDATDSALAAAFMLLCKQIAPGVLTATLGKLVERVTIRTGLVAAYLLAGASLGVLTAVGYGPVLFIVAVLSGATGTTVRALLRTSVARSTTGDDLRAANGLLNVVMGVVALAAPAIGALLVGASDATTALGITAAGAVALAAVSAAMPRAIASAVVGDVEEPAGDEEDVRDPAPTPAGRPVSSAALLTLGGLVFALFAMDEPALLAYTERSLHSGVGGYGVILAAWGAGMILGSLAYGRLMHRPMSSLFVWSTAVTAIGYLGLGVAPTIAVACLLAIIGGAGNGVIWVSLVTAIQESAGVDQQGKMAARLEGIATATPAVGVIIGGIVADAVTPRYSLLIPGLLSLLAVAVWLVGQRATDARTHATTPRPKAEPTAIEVPST